MTDKDVERHLGTKAPRKRAVGLISFEEAHRLLVYDASTGEMYWKIDVGGGSRAGDRAGYTTFWGYRQISIKCKMHFVHRLAWLMTYGEWPKGEIDHINGQRSDNRLSNLRDLDHALNAQNLRAPKSNNKSGFLGVSRKDRGWRATLKVNGKQLSLGVYATPEEAHKVYLEAKRALHEACSI